MKAFIKLSLLLLTVLLSTNLFSQISFRSVSSAATSTGSSITIGKPSNLTSGDMMIATISQTDKDNNSLSTNASRTGWTVISGSSFYSSGNNEWRGTVLYKIANSTDVNGSNFSFNLDSDNDNALGAIMAFSGVDNTNPLDINYSLPSSLNNNSGSNTGSILATSITTTYNSSAIVLVGFLENDGRTFSNFSATSPSSLTTIFGNYENNTDNLDMGMGAAWGVKTSAGSTGSGIANLSNNSRSGSILIGLRQAPVAISNNNLSLSSSTICSGASPSTISGSTPTGGSGTYTYQWESSTTSSSTGFANVASSGTSKDYSPSALSQTTWFRRVVSSTGVSNSTSSAIRVLVNETPTLTSPTELFINSTTRLIGTLTAAAVNPWTSSNSAIATFVDGSDLKGITEGTTTVTYTASNGCSTSQVVTVGAELDYEYFVPAGGSTNIPSRTIPYQSGSVTYFNRDNAKWVKFKINASGMNFHKLYADVDQSGFNVQYVTGGDTEITSGFTSSSATGVTDIELKLVSPIVNASGELRYLLVQTKNAGGFIFTNTFQLAAAALPVTLSSFTAKPTPDNKVSLAWVTSTEQVNKGFRIERQAGNENGKFEQIGFVGSKAKDGNSQNMLTYNFIDAAPKVCAASFYRLVQEDLDGKLTYTEVRVVKLNGQSVSMVFPNPSNGAVNISRTADGKKMNIQVIDQSGRIISQVNNITDANYRMNISQSGIYSIKMMYPETGEESIQRVVVQK